MASKQTYKCFVCKKNGFPETRVYLDGKDENGKTIYRNEDMSPHSHKRQQQQQTRTPVDLWNIINQKLDKIITLLESMGIQNKSPHYSFRK